MDKKHILIVEDDAALASFLSEKLTSEGFGVEIAVDGEKALQMIGNKPDLILLDIMLPKIDGLVVMKATREAGEWGIKVPIIITSNLSPDDGHVINSVTTYSPAYYLVKSEHSLDDIVKNVKEVMALR